jgi:hypothetical protein
MLLVPYQAILVLDQGVCAFDVGGEQKFLKIIAMERLYFSILPESL